MLTQPLTKAERDELLARAAKAMARYRTAMNASDTAGAAKVDREADAAIAEYFQRLPIVAMAACPFSGKPLMRSFDPFGLDGPWWADGAKRPALPQPPTFCVLRGGVHFQAKKVIGPPAVEVCTGPEVPYVIPRLLELGNMTAVIGELSMTPGYRVFTIAYFAEPRRSAKELTSDWPDTSYSYTTLFGESASVIPVDPWDFDLAPWIKKGRVRWCIPGSGNEKVAPAGKPADCPYLDLEGRRENLAVRGDRAWNRGLPDGEPITPADLLD